MRRVSSAVVATALSVSAACAQDKCGDVLAAAYDVTSTRVDFSSKKAARAQACASGKTTTSANGGVVVEGLPISFGGNHDEENAYCNDTLTIDEVTNRVDQKIIAVHDTVIAAWKDCMTGPLSYGPHVSLTPTADPATVNLALSYSDPRAGAVASLASLSLTNVNCPDTPKPGDKVGPLRIHTCRRDPAKYAQVNVAFEGIAAPMTQSLQAEPTRVPFTPVQLAKVYSTSGLGGLVTFQNGKKVGWGYKEATVEHDVSGSFVSDTKFIALQKRKDTKDGCISLQVLVVDVVGNTLVVRGRMEPPGTTACGVTDAMVAGPGIATAK